MTLPVAPTDALARLPQYSADPVSTDTPYGMDGDGAETNFPLACGDVAAAANYVGAAAAEIAVIGAAVAADAAAVEIAATAATTARDEAVAAAAAVRSLPITLRDGSAAHVLTVSGSSIPLILRDGSTVLVAFT